MTPAERHPFLATPVPWHFPLASAHWGVPLGNGTFGALLWGEGRDLRVTVNRQDYWDHRGGTTWTDEATFANLRKWLEAGDEENLRRVFEGQRTGAETDPPIPTRLPMGRVDLKLPEGAALTTGQLALDSSIATFVSDGGPAARALLVRHDPILAIEVDSEDVAVASAPPDAPEVLEHFARYGFPPAELFHETAETTGVEIGGWAQECPGEPAMCVAWQAVRIEGRTEILVTSVFGETPQAAREEALATLSEHDEAGLQQLFDRTAAWWSGYWARIAAVALPDSERELLYYLGMYKLAGLSVPGGPAATLQGPWVEEYRLPPWASDYHFNINVQECYWPAFAGNFLPALEPLWEMLHRWEPRLRANARVFAGVSDGLQLPHAVDDRCTCMGGFWTGSVDHGSTTWTGQLMWQQWRHSRDREFLRATAYPFLKGALRVYEAMLDDDGQALSLPVGVSPEFGGAELHAWGRNASFQLANIHFLCNALTEASEVLETDAELRGHWRDIAARLPRAAVDPATGIALWEGKSLPESHRHHSHLAGLYPFEVFDYQGSEADRGLLDASLNTLIYQGMGLWTGWCVPWAAILYARTGNGEMADVLLGIFRRSFMGPGYASTHDARFRGFTLMAGRPDIMQIEACMGAAAAVLELLVQAPGGLLRILPAVPNWWRDVSFDGIRADGAFLVSARQSNGRLEQVRVVSEAGETLRLLNPWPGCEVSLTRADGTAEVLSGEVLQAATAAGETLELAPAG